MKNRIKEVMSAVLSIPIEEISDDASPDNLDAWDSLKQMNLIIALEDEFDIELSDDQVIEMIDFECIARTLSEVV